MLVKNMQNGRVYRLRREEDMLVFYYAAKSVREAGEAMRSERSSDEPDGRDICIRMQTIRETNLGEMEKPVRCLNIRTNTKKYRFQLLDKDEVGIGEALEDEVSDGQGRVEKKRKAVFAKKRGEKIDPVRKEKLKKICRGLEIYAFATAIPVMFLDVVNSSFGFLAILTMPLVLGLYLRFPEYFTLEENKHRQAGRIGLSKALFLAGAAPVIDLIFGYKLSSWGRLILLCIVPLIVLMTVVLRRIREWRKKKLLLWAPILGIFLWLFGTLGYANIWLDREPAEDIPAIVVEKDIKSGRKGRNSYYITVQKQDGDMTEGNEIRMSVSTQRFNEIAVGDEGAVLIHPGALGIEYSEIILED